MTKDQAIQKIWDYMHMNHKLKKADVIFVLGNRDIRVAEYAAKLYHDEFAPVILFSGSGDIHNHKPGREQFAGSTEAEVFADVAQKLGVPQTAILIENKSQNTGDNYKFAIELLKQKGISVLITDHNAREIFSIVDRSYLVRDGKVLLSGTVDELLSERQAVEHLLK